MTEPINLAVQGNLNDFGLPEEGLLYLQFSLIPDYVAEYVRLIELEKTNRICKCEWIVHPDDVDKPEGQRKIRKGEPALDCPVHTKEGFLIGFFRWVVVGGQLENAIDVTGLDKVEHEYVKTDNLRSCGLEHPPTDTCE